MTPIRRGARVPRPDRFRPTVLRETARFIYALDLDQGIMRRSAARSSDPTPTTYFAISRSVAPITPKRQDRLLRWVVRPVLASVALASFMLLIFPYYPAVEYHFNQQFGPKAAQASDVAAGTSDGAVDIPNPLTTTNQLIIPKIGVATNIVEGKSINVLLKTEGVWHQTGSFINGTMVIAGHRFRYLPPNTSTFYNLGQVKTDDVVAVDWYGHRYEFAVDNVTTVPNTDTDLLKSGPPGRLIIYTCQDLRMSQRIVVRAHLLG